MSVGKMFPNAQLDEIINETFREVKALRKLKGAEYAGTAKDDCLGNFRRAGANLSLPMEVIWLVYAGKHWDAVSQYVRDILTGQTRQRMEGIEGRVDDIITYCLLLKAMIEEGKDTLPTDLSVKSDADITEDQLKELMSRRVYPSNPTKIVS